MDKLKMTDYRNDILAYVKNAPDGRLYEQICKEYSSGGVREVEYLIEHGLIESIGHKCFATLPKSNPEHKGEGVELPHVCQCSRPGGKSEGVDLCLTDQEGELSEKPDHHSLGGLARDIVSELADNHWGYVESVLKQHGAPEDIIEASGFHYRTAFCHGYKHGQDEQS
jgi:hypothetical protein